MCIMLLDNQDNLLKGTDDKTGPKNRNIRGLPVLIKNLFVLT